MRAAVLVLINGVPGAGKSRLAVEVATRRERARVIDIDAVRMTFDEWWARPATNAAARDRGCELIADSLGSGHDVIVPQFVGRSEFVARLRNIAATQGATWTEVFVDAEVDTAIDRFRSRRAALRLHGELHPESDVADDDIDDAIRRASAALQERCTREPITPIDGVDIQRSERQINEIIDFFGHRSHDSSFSISDGVVKIRSPIDADRAALVAMRDDVVAQWLGNSSDNPTPMACIERDGIVVGWVDSDGEPLPHLNASQLNVGYALARNVRGAGIATRALYLLLHRLAVVGETRAATLLIDRDNHASLGVAARASFRATNDIANNRLFTRAAPPLVYSDGVVTIRPRRLDDLGDDISAKDVEQQRWLWLPEHRRQWSKMSDLERQRHAATTLRRDVESFGRGPKWAFSVDGPQQRNVGYVDVDLANDRAPIGESNISYATHPEHRRRGYAPRAVHLVVRFLAEHTGARVAHLSVADDNLASRRVVEAIGANVVDSWTDVEDRVIQRHRLPIVRA